MVRLRPSASENVQNDNVLLYVVGPKSIIPKPVFVNTSLSNTWLKLLNDDLNLGVTVDQRVFVCGSGYCPTAPKAGVGWKSELNEPIQTFIDKFERKRKQYRVRICYSYDASDNQEQPTDNQQSQNLRVPTPPTSTTSRRGRSAARSISPARQPNIVISTDRNNTTVIPISSNDASSSSSSQEENGSRLTRAQQHALRIPKDIRTNGHLAKRPKMQNYTEVHIQTDIPSVPGPHVFFNEETLNATQMLRIDNFRSVVKTECISEYYDELEEDLDDEYEYEDDEEAEGERVEEQDERNEDIQNGEQEQEQQNIEEEEDDDFGGMSDVEVNGDNNGDELEDKQEAEELRQLGIRLEDVKSGADRRFTGFSNAYLLRVQNEMQTLTKDKEWVDVFQRSPLSFYFIQEMLKKE